MLPRFFSLLLFPALLYTNYLFSQEQESLSTCEKARQAAAKDAFKNQQKYYFYGIAGPDKSVIEKAQKLGVEVVSRGCVRNDGDDCYNHLADSIVYVRSGVRISSLR